ncbi:hypothetical protein DL95DRAFT_392803 [Leptodontidium sp. 2 PMI_412]|nr:hypothetical protein DL95DRAFT_392803 [Leptodontidium sp. 2 PMI_412]
MSDLYSNDASSLPISLPIRCFTIFPIPCAGLDLHMMATDLPTMRRPRRTRLLSHSVDVTTHFRRSSKLSILYPRRIIYRHCHSRTQCPISTLHRELDWTGSTTN